MTEFITRNHGYSCFEIMIKTTDPEHYRKIQDFVRWLIDHAKPVSNADRIRAMSDEELAQWMAGCNAWKEYADASQWLPWLRQPAQEVTENG